MLAIIEKGGPIMWPLLAVSVLSLTILFERILFIITFILQTNQTQRNKFVKLLTENNLKDALSLASYSKDPFLQTIAESNSTSIKSFQISFREEAAYLLRKITKGLGILDTSITIAPLLGLLGTVSGLMQSFANLGTTDLNSPLSVTGGIGEALLATAFGLTIAIVNLVPFNYLSNLEVKSRETLERIGTQVEELI
jgi:biopolymer transport protein ExbB